MFNTFKEMQESIPYDDLHKYTYESLEKSPAEIKELLKSYNIEISDSVAQEYYDFIKDLGIINDDELDNVVGGACTSGDSYDKLGIFHSIFQNGSNNPVIVTVGNSCRLSKRTCVNCKYSTPIGVTYYCGLRSEQNDPADDPSYELQNDGSSVRHNNTVEIISY